MATSLGSAADRHLCPQHQPPEAPEQAAPEQAVRGAQTWIEEVTGRSFGEKDLRGSLDNGVLLCELLNCIKPGLVKKINRLPTPLAGLDNLSLFLKGCEELGLKGSQLFDPGDLQDLQSSSKGSDCTKKIKNVLITIYWLGRAANSSATYNGPTLDLREFEGLLSLMRKELEDWDSPKRSIRDSGYIDCWESERSDSLSPPRHARDDSFDSLDSIGSRSRHTPSPDGLFARGSSDGRGSDSECDVPFRKLPDVRRDDMLARRTSCSEPRTAVPFNQYLPNKSNQSSYMAIPLRKHRNTELEESCKSWSNTTSPVGGDRPFRYSRSDSVFDDPESMSMIDVRDEENGMLPPHSQVRHELIHGQYHRMKEEENQWQDDLAKWKSRRRSMSQDLLKKEEERKMMERLMSLDDGTHRRKSIKTYREIVEDKERRERALQEAYHRAKTPEEAAAVLQRYAQRFTISEAVLERLKLPQALEHSISADPTRLPHSPTDSDFLSSLESSNSLQYLRQQSLPKFTTTVEARVSFHGTEQGNRRNVDSGSGKALTGPRVPLPVLYNHDQRGKDAMQTVNGQLDKDFKERRDAQDFGIERAEEEDRDNKEDTSPLIFYPLANQDAESESTEMSVSKTLSSDDNAISHSRSCTVELQQLEKADIKKGDQHGMEPGPEGQQEEDRRREEASSQNIFLSMQPKVTEEFLQVGGTSPSQNHKGPGGKSPENELCMDKQQENPESAANQSSHSFTSNSFEQVIKPAVETSNRTEHHPDQSRRDHTDPTSSSGHPTAEPEGKRHENAGPVVLNLVKRGEHFSWDPEEERKRQERWQQEQERMLQEKYHREQEKLKHEWELAQKEVEEEGRKYHEEERRILEETSAPLTPHSPVSPSFGWQEPGSHKSPVTHHTIVRSLAEWERKQEELEKQMKGIFNKNQKENERKESAKMKKESSDRPEVQGHELLLGQATGRTEGAAELNLGQVPASQDVLRSSNQHQPPSEQWQKKASMDSTKNTQAAPSGRRRSGSIETAGAKSSQFISPTDTQQPPSSPNRSVSGKKLCTSCGQPLGKGAAMIIETLSLCFHIQCFRCGICKGQLGDTTTGTDVRIRNGLLNCHQCYIRSRSTGQPTNL